MSMASAIRPRPGDAVVPPMNADAVVEIVSVSEIQPLAGLGVFQAIDQYGEEILLRHDGSFWKAVGPDGLDEPAGTLYLALRGDLLERRGDAEEFLRHIVWKSGMSQDNKAHLAAHAAEMLDPERLPAAMESVPDPQGMGEEDWRDIAIAAAVLRAVEDRLPSPPIP